MVSKPPHIFVESRRQSDSETYALRDSLTIQTAVACARIAAGKKTHPLGIIIHVSPR